MKWYDNDMKQRGFTIVELAIVIVVIAILAAITIVSYRGVQRDGMDTKIRSVVKTAGDAVALKESRGGARPAAGYFSTGVDSLVPEYLKTGYRDGLTSENVNNNDRIFKFYPCADGGGGFIIYASLNNPTSDDTTTFNKLRTACGHGTSQAPTSGNLIYNYAQLF